MRDSLIIFLSKDLEEIPISKDASLYPMEITKDAKAYVFTTIIVPFLLITFMISSNHNFYLKMGLCFVYIFLNFKLPKPKRSIKFRSILFGHRCGEGKGGEVENSLEALANAIEHGTSGIEIDVQLTKDKEIVIFHDILNIHRLCETPSSWEGKKKKCRISKLTLSELKECKFKGVEATIPTLEEFVIQFLKHKEKRIILMIEVKQYRKIKTMAKKLSELYKKYPDLYDLAFVASFNPFILYRTRQIDPAIATCICSHRSLFSSFILDGLGGLNANFLLKGLFFLLDSLYYVLSTNTVLSQFLGPQIISVDKDIDEKYIKKFQKRGLNTICWTVNDQKDKERLQKKGVSVISDKI